MRDSSLSPGGIFVTGHDADYHALRGAYNAVGAQHLLQRAVAYVTYNRINPKILVVTDVRSPDGDESDPRAGMQAAGFAFDVADYGSGIFGLMDLRSVSFAAYDVVVVASDYGGWLRQDELAILNARACEIAGYINNGGGLVVLGESGGRPAPAYPGTSHDRYAFVPGPISSVSKVIYELGVSLTQAGTAMGLVADDVNGNVAHAFLQPNGIMDVIDVDSEGHVLSLAMRGKGLPIYSISGRVTSGGEAVSGISISAGPTGQATTDASGYYTMTGLITGTYTLIPSSPYWTFSPPTQTATVPPDAPATDFQAALTAPLYPRISGPSHGKVNASYLFSASPVGTPTLPITYTWEATDHSPISHTGGATDSVSFAWSEAGTKLITVTAANAQGWATSTHAITVSVPPATVSLVGPDASPLNATASFRAVLTPMTTSLPLVYIWQADDLPAVYKTGGLSSAVDFAWVSAGSKTISVTVANEAGAIVGSRVVTVAEYAPLTGISLNGPTSGRIGYAYTFNSSAAPLMASLPVTYVWQATGLDPVSHSAGLTDAATLVWTVPGRKTVTVTASNIWGTVSASRTFTAQVDLYLPMLRY